jgi:hypothetical protein
VAEVRPFQVCHGQVGAAKHCPAQISEDEVCVTQIALNKIGTDVRMLRSPLIPCIYVGEKRSNVFRVSHASNLLHRCGRPAASPARDWGVAQKSTRSAS